MLFYLIKLIRLYKGFEILDVTQMMFSIKQYYARRLNDNIIEQRLAKERKLGGYSHYRVFDTWETDNDLCLQDMTHIGEIVVISYTLKTLKLVVVIANLTYMTALFWYILCKGSDEFYEAYLDVPGDGGHDSFILKNDLESKSVYECTVRLVYFAFTSLSTVGFGDYAPISNVERIAGAFMLLLGVAIFSYIMGNFIGILHSFKNFNEDIEDENNLNRFFGTLQKFNGGANLPQELQKQIEKHFDYRWSHDKN